MPLVLLLRRLAPESEVALDAAKLVELICQAPFWSSMGVGNRFGLGFQVFQVGRADHPLRSFI